MATLLQFQLHRPLSSAMKKMSTNRPSSSSSPFLPASNDGEPVLDSLSTSELISFLESSFKLSDFKRVADILNSREKSAKSEALRELSVRLSNVAAKTDSMEKEVLPALRKLQKEIMIEKQRNLSLKGSYDKIEKLGKEKIKVLMEDVEKERANCSGLEVQLEKTRSEKTAEIDSWKSKYSKLEAWILRFLEKNPQLIEREVEKRGDRT